MNPLIPPATGEISSLLSFYKDGFGIKLPMKFDMPLNQLNQTKPNQIALTAVGLLYEQCHLLLTSHAPFLLRYGDQLHNNPWFILY